jgi:Glycosyl hydrolase-like 10
VKIRVLPSRLVVISVVFLILSAVVFDTHAKAEDGRTISGNNDILITELDKAVDPKLIQNEPTDPNLWRTIPYQSEAFSGVMLGEGDGPKHLPIAVKLQAKGRYRIFLGLYDGFSGVQLRVKLSDDPSSTVMPISVKKGDRTLFIREVYWKEADLTEQDLIIEGMSDDLHSPAALAFVRLEAVPERKDFYPFATTVDGHGVFRGPEHDSPRDILRELEEIPDETCMRMLFWGNGCADNCNYPTKVGQFYPNAGRETLWNRNFAKNTGLWKEKGWNSMEVVRDYARKRNWEFQVYIRMEAFKAPFPFDVQESSKFFNEHPEYRCLDREGGEVGRLSYAYPEVQEYMASLIKEIADYDPDGVCLCFIRGVPVVLYEPIMVQGFKNRYGIDPRTLDELDPRWMDYQCEVITSFIKRAKKALKPNQRLSVIVPANELDCRRWGLDVATWVKDGLIDDLMPTGQRFDAVDVHRDDPDRLDFKFFASLQGREKIRLIPLLYAWSKFGSDFEGWERLMHSFMDQGADAYAVWDATAKNRFSKVKDMGKTIDKYKRPEPPANRKIKLKSIQGMRLDRYHYFEVV